MQQHIEKLKGRPWQKALLGIDFSVCEYTLYGVFIDEILRLDNLTEHDQPFNLIAWDRASFDALRSDALSGRQLPLDKLLCASNQTPTSLLRNAKTCR